MNDRDDATAEADGDPQDDAASLQAQLDDERAKAASLYQSWQREAADFRNYKRRVEDDRSEMARAGNAALVINVLPILDDLDRALATVDPEIAERNWVDGIRLIQRKFQTLIDMAGGEEIAAQGEIFDPTQHEAVSQAPGEDNRVIAVVQKGYKLGERVIRPAMVVVGHGGASGAAAQ